MPVQNSHNPPKFPRLMRIASLQKMFLKLTTTLTITLLVGAASSSTAGTSIAVNFSGRGVNNDFGTGAFLTTTETAGVTPQAHWNNVDINGGNPASGTTLGLIDSGYNFT